MRARPRRPLLAIALVSIVGGLLAVVRGGPASAAPAVIHIEGGGFGHGVGLSQYGARGLATQGRSAAQILGHYYSGTAVQALPQPAGIRIWLGEEAGGTGLTPSGNVQFVVAGNPVANAGAGDSVRVNLVGGKFQIVINGANAGGPVGGGPDNVYALFEGGGPLKVEKTGYRYTHGILELHDDGGSVRIVMADLSMQEYLLGLGEMPSSWPAEALKAQAIAGRTYAKEKIERLGNQRAECGCGLFGTTRDQNYTGYEKEVGTANAPWVSAVNSTDNLTVTSGGAAIEAYYSSSSGGHTENSEFAFATARSYLKGVPDPADGFDNPVHRWSRDYPRGDLERWLNAASDTNIGTLERVEFVPPFGVSGRVGRVNGDQGGVRIVSAGGSVTKRVSGDRFRGVVNSGVSTDGGGISLQILSNLMRSGGWLAFGEFTGGVFIGAGRLSSAGADRVAVGADTGGGPHVRIFEPDGTAAGGGFFAYDPAFRGGVRIAVCNLVEGASVGQIVTAPGPGGGPHVRVFNADGGELSGFMAYDQRWRGGVYVACGDVTGDGLDEVILGAGSGGGPHVRIVNRFGQDVAPGFMAYDPRFPNGVRVATAKFDGGVTKDFIVTGAGPGGGPHVRVFRGDATAIGGGFFAYDPRNTGGVWVGGGDTNGDGLEEIITGSGAAGAHVRMFDAVGGDRGGFFAFETGNDRGVRVAYGRFPNAGIVTGSGGGGRAIVRVVGV